jgi:Family of unknown function (DUF6011)
MATVKDIAESLVSRCASDTEQQRKLNPDRRPTWAPPIPFSPELGAGLERYKQFTIRDEYDSRFGRLWAVWSEPKRCGGKLVGFDLRAGKYRNGAIITQLNPRGHGIWNVGPKWVYPSQVNPAKKLRSREEIEQYFLRKKYGEHFKEYPEDKERIIAAAIKREQEDFEKDQDRFAKDQKNFNMRHEVFHLLESFRDLGWLEILRFVDAPDAVMQVGGRIAGICCCCGRLLSDPTSVQLGIGPECRGDR